MQQVTKTAREITKKPVEDNLVDSDKDDEEDSTDDEELIGPLPPPLLGKRFTVHVTCFCFFIICRFLFLSCIIIIIVCS